MMNYTSYVKDYLKVSMLSQILMKVAETVHGLKNHERYDSKERDAKWDDYLLLLSLLH